MIKHNGVEISDYTINITATQSLCSGIASATFTLAANYSSPISVWDVFEIDNMPSFYVSSVSRELPEYTIKVVCQDATKRLTDYYVSENYQVVEGQTNYYWLDKILSETGIQYNITDDYYVSYLNPETQVGMSSAMDIVTSLIQQGGCFFYVDTNNVLQIKKVNKGNPIRSFSDSEILSINTTKDDKMLRNRVIVRGKGNPVSGVWVQAEKKVTTPYNYDESDIRTSVMYNSGIGEQGLANSLAKRLSDELKKITFVTTIEVPGTYNISIGNTIFLNSNFRSGECLVTTKEVSYASTGIITTFILDERCARILGIYGDDGYVYIGTIDAGIWRKPLKTNHTWENFSEGLEASYVRYLDIAYGVFTTVLGNGRAFYRNIGTNSWNILNPGALYTVSGEEYIQGTYPDTISGEGYYYAAGSCIDKSTGEIYTTYTTKITEERGYMYAENITDETTWLCKFTSNGNLISKQIVDLNANSNFYNINIQSDGQNIYGIYATPSWMKYNDEVDNLVYDGFFSNLDRDGVAYSPSGAVYGSSKKPNIYNFKVYDCILTNAYTTPFKWKFLIFDATNGTFTYSPEFETSLNIGGGDSSKWDNFYNLIVFYKETENAVYTVFRWDGEEIHAGGEVWKYDLNTNTVSLVRTIPEFAVQFYTKYGYYYTDNVYDTVTGELIGNNYLMFNTITSSFYIRDRRKVYLQANIKIQNRKDLSIIADVHKEILIDELPEDDEIVINIGTGSAFDLFGKRYVEDKGYLLLHQTNRDKFFRISFDIHGNLSVSPISLTGGSNNPNWYQVNYGESRFAGDPRVGNVIDLATNPASLVTQAGVCLDYFTNDIYKISQSIYDMPLLARINKDTREVKEYLPRFSRWPVDIRAKWGNILCLGKPEYIVYGAKEDFDYWVRLNSYLLLRKDEDNFTNVYGFPTAYTTEINQDSVISLYDAQGHALFYDTVENKITGFDDALYIQDLRYFNTASPIEALSGTSYFLIGAWEGNILVDRETFDAHQYSIIDTIKCETTNYGDIPYMFVAGYGHFYQKDRVDFPSFTASEFIARDDNRPNSTITVIRCDDEL